MLCDSDRMHALRACLIVYALTETAIVPQQFQLEAVLATLNGQDTIITAGTGSGKTLCIIIPISLRPGTITMTISPLKRLQATQVTELECIEFVRVHAKLCYYHRFSNRQNMAYLQLQSTKTLQQICLSGR
jgi:superfamily II DNA helicase RecQ